MGKYKPYLSFWVCVSSLRIIIFFFIFTHLPVNIFNGWAIFHCIYVPFFFIYSFIKEHLGCFQFLSIMNWAAMNMVEQEGLWLDELSFGYMVKNGIAGSWSRLTSMFLRKYHTNFHSDYASLQSHQQLMSILFKIISSPAWTVISIINLSHSHRHKLKSQSSFHLHFPDDQKHWTFLFVLLRHLNFFYWEFSI